MLGGAKRRISILERSIPVWMTPERFLARAEELSRLTGTSYDDAFHSLAASLSEPDLDRLVEEFIQLACGDDMGARDEIMRLAAIEAAGTDGSQREAAATE